MYSRSTETSAQPPRSPIPAGAIAAGIAAGALLAVVMTLWWVQWGKRRNRPQLVQWSESEAKTKQDTMHRAAALSEPRSASQEPLFPHPTERKIKFEMRPNDLESGSASTLIGLPEVSKPRPLRSAKGSSHSLLGARDRYFTPASPKMAHKPSTVSSISMYSTASGEEHQVRVPPHLILAATGGLAADPAGRYSAASSNWSFLSRMTPGVQGNGSRNSQASSRSPSVAPSRDSLGVLIGVAL